MFGPIPYGKQNIEAEDIQAVVEVLKSDFLTQGPKVQEFEEKFSQYIGSTHAIAVSNGTAALHLGALALGVKPGSRVITSPITFAASANAILYCGGDVDFVDIDPKTLCIDLNRVEDLLKKHPNTYQGIVPVDFAGYPVDLVALRSITEKYGIWIMEDACHAPGASFQSSSGEMVRSGDGKYADLAIFSFHPVKHIACGEGGMVTTNRVDLAKKIKRLRTHGITKERSEMTRFDGGWYHEMQELGFNYRMPDMLCALGITQLSRAKRGLERRQEIALRYDQELNSLPITLPVHDYQKSHAYHLYVIRTKKRAALYEHLKKDNIYAQVHYLPVYQHPYYQKRYGSKSLECAEKYYQECLSIPMFHSMAPEEQTRVIDSIKRFFA